MCLVETGVGAAGAAVLPLAALHHARNLQARHYRETPIPHLQGAAHDRQFIKKKKKKSAGGAKFSDKNRLEFPHHERWDNWLLKLSFKSVHQLLSFGVVKRQNTWRETQRQTYLTVYFIKICFF